MAGILANSVSQTMVSGDTATDKTVTKYLVGEMIALTTYPTGTDYSWAQSRPSAAGSVAGLTSATASGPTFVPNASGTYLVTADVDGTDYVIRIGVSAVGVATSADIVRVMPIIDATCPTPPTGYRSLYNSSTQAGLSVKDSDALVRKLALSGVTLTTRITDSDHPYTALATDDTIFVDTDGGVVTVSLPAGVDNKRYRIVNCGSGANDVTVTPNGAELINGASSSITLNDAEKVVLEYETTEGWW